MEMVLVKGVNMSTQKVEIKNDSLGFLVILVLLLAMNACVGVTQQQEDLKVKKQQLEMAKKQYTLDSLRFEHMKSQQK